MLVKDLLEFKSSDKVASVLSQSTVAGAAKQMLNFNIGFVLVLENSQLVGVLSERDIVYKSTALKLDPIAQKVADIMTKDIVFVNENTELKEVLELFKKMKFRHLPVKKEDGSIAGVLSERDITTFLMSKLS
ncbi:MAG: CBS domain-containing protein [Deltaproteobacteria bacterium]|nr:MAG: CBS domain-containing protein [Deltaproteobacteria bacterium]